MNEPAGYLSTHVLDTVRGAPAAGVKVALYAMRGDARTLITETTTNADGRTDSPLIARGELSAGLYELEFDIGAYFAESGEEESSPFLERIPIRFRVDDEDMHYHVPLLAAPFSYSTYRGS